MRTIDRERWERVAAGPPQWDGRSAAVARYIQPGETVLDLGAGAGGLRAHLPAGCRYQPADCVAGDGVLELDLATADTGEIATDAFDVVVLAGVLEHLDDPQRALELATSWGRRAVVTYASRLDGPPSPEWRNHFSLEELISLVLGASLSVSLLGSWQEQVILRVRR